MSRIGTVLGIFAALLLAAAPAASAADAPGIFGVWKNPKNSVHLEIKPCGEQACGVVIWATDEAKADVLRGSGKDLVGLQLFRELEQQANGVWRGKVFVPDLNRTFTGTAEAVEGGQALKARGCFLANIFCKTQVWRRIG